MNKITKTLIYIHENIFKTILSPTYALAKILKNVENLDQQAKRIKFLNQFYLSISVVIFFLLFIFFNPGDDLSYLGALAMLVTGYYSVSRINEIFFAFSHDSVDRLKCKKNDSRGLKYSDRVRLAFRSYLELILDYGIIYYILDTSILKFLLNQKEMFNKKSLSIMDTLYYSGVTITTLGYGDFLPVHPICKFLSVYEVINGMLLIVVCFTIYVTANFQSMPDCPEDRTRKNMISTKWWLLIALIIFISFASYSVIRYMN